MASAFKGVPMVVLAGGGYDSASGKVLLNTRAAITGREQYFCERSVPVNESVARMKRITKSCRRLRRFFAGSFDCLSASEVPSSGDQGCVAEVVNGQQRREIRVVSYRGVAPRSAIRPVEVSAAARTRSTLPSPRPAHPLYPPPCQGIL